MGTATSGVRPQLRAKPLNKNPEPIIPIL